MVVSLVTDIAKQSNLSPKQLESLMSYIKISSGQLRYKDAAALRTGHSVTVGSYFRTVQQGKRRVRESIVTVLIAVSIGLVKSDDFRRLLELMGRAGLEVAEDDRERFSVILRTLIDRIVI